MTVAEKQLDAMIERYSSEVAGLARKALAKVRKLLPGAVELVYDNYNALAVAFGPTDRTADVILSLTLYPRWVSLFFAQGARLPQKRLSGNGKRVRHLVIESIAVLDEPEVRALVEMAVAQATAPLSKRRVIIKSVAANQRPRRPKATK
jgi:hypothetical protein